MLFLTERESSWGCKNTCSSRSHSSIGSIDEMHMSATDRTSVFWNFIALKDYFSVSVNAAFSVNDQWSENANDFTPDAMLRYFFHARQNMASVTVT